MIATDSSSKTKEGVMKLDKKAFGLALGLLWGFGLLIATLWATIAQGGAHLGLLNRFYIGYSVSYLGAVVGLIYGFVDGFICGWLLAWLYNRFAASA
jgi:hypothetical protein